MRSVLNRPASRRPCSSALQVVEECGVHGVPAADEGRMRTFNVDVHGFRALYRTHVQYRRPGRDPSRRTPVAARASRPNRPVSARRWPHCARHGRCRSTNCRAGPACRSRCCRRSSAHQANPTVAVVWRLANALGVGDRRIAGRRAPRPRRRLTTVPAHATPTLAQPRRPVRAAHPGSDRARRPVRVVRADACSPAARWLRRPTSRVRANT